MKFNNNKNFSANRKSIIIRLCAVVFIVVIGFVILALIIPYSNQAVKSMTINEVIASTTLFISLGTIVIKISENVLRQNFTAKRKLTIETKSQDNYAIITCRIENCSKKRIIPQNIYLMVEAGIEKDGIIDFPYLLKHEEGEFDCVFASLCKQGGFICLPDHLLEDDFKAQYRKIIKLKQLSSETIMFIDPGEEFSEDVILKLEKGIYKATIVWTSVEEDCICGTKQFVI
ncbi:MAG: hypothetical protein HDT21_06035 [Ruminococcus sp.]|nr:hypothetical protein [Ruminococcus sp.]